MDGKRLSVTGLGATLRRLALTAGIGGCALLGTGATVTTALPAVGVHVAPMHSVGVASGHGNGGGGAGNATASVCWASSNWSGYALSTSSPSGLPCVPGSGVLYTSVTANWTVPAVTAGSRGSTYSAVWTGIDGFTNSNLIQAGTEQDVISGVAHYDAWWEILPAAETVIPSITVKPGDALSVTITSGSPTWTITVTDSGSSSHPGTQSFTTHQAYSGPGTSAEWIVEAPTVGGRQAVIANYGSAIFDDGTVNGSPVVLHNGTSGELVQKSRFGSQVVSIASAPDSGSPAADGFAAAYGSTAPSAPTG